MNFLVAQGLAKRIEGRVLLSRDLLSALRKPEIDQMGKATASETGLVFREITHGLRGVYRIDVALEATPICLHD